MIIPLQPDEIKKKVIIVSGYWNPLHIGHINCFSEAKKKGDILIAITNSDEQVKLKGSVPFMSQEERIEIVKAIKYIDEVVLSIDKDKSVCKTLELIAEKHLGSELFFANGGDRHAGNIPETPILEKFNIKTIDGVGGEKVQSSSWLLKNSMKS